MAALAAAGYVASAGCGSGPETEYGSSRGSSINGISAFASMLRNRGHELRTAVRLTDELKDWAQGIIRFAPYPGPPARDEAAWYQTWLAAAPDRWLMYVVRDFDAEAEYWAEVRDGLSEQSQADRRAEAEEKRSAATGWVNRLPSRAKDGADPVTWFGPGPPLDPPRVCTRLSGPWAADLDGAAAALPLHEPLDGPGQRVLTDGDDKTFVLEKTRSGQGRVLVIANGSFLLNAGLIKAARRPLALRALDWPGRAVQRIALLEGSFVLAKEEREPGLWELLRKLPTLRWIALQLGMAGLLAALARAVRLGRPHPEPASEADRPAAHAEALGALLARSSALAEAHAHLDQFRHWRHVPGSPSKRR
jgi:hypothetical protein